MKSLNLLKNVKEYFKDALKIECLETGDQYQIEDDIDLIEVSNNIAFIPLRNSNILLYKDGNYAKVIQFKQIPTNGEEYFEMPTGDRTLNIIPILKVVKEYFKDALEIESCFNIKFDYKPIKIYYDQRFNIWFAQITEKIAHPIWAGTKGGSIKAVGYAKITKFKETLPAIIHKHTKGEWNFGKATAEYKPVPKNKLHKALLDKHNLNIPFVCISIGNENDQVCLIPIDNKSAKANAKLCLAGISSGFKSSKDLQALTTLERNLSSFSDA